MIYAMSDIHGCLQEFEEALKQVDFSDEDTKLILMGDYVHCGPDSYGVLDKIMELQKEHGSEKVIVLMGNHDEWALEGRAPIQESWEDGLYDSVDGDDDRYLSFLQNLPLYHVEDDVIFVHAGIDEASGENWEWESTDRDFLEKYPAETGYFEGEMTIVAGHIGTSEIAENPRFHDIFFDGESHYYIDGSVYEGGNLNVLIYDEKEKKFYQGFDGGKYEIEAYEE